LLWISLVFICQQIFLGINSGKENIFANSYELLFAGLLLGIWERGLGNREDGTHGSLQTNLKRRFTVAVR
jgi:hypothetical protein